MKLKRFYVRTILHDKSLHKMSFKQLRIVSSAKIIDNSFLYGNVTTYGYLMESYRHSIVHNAHIAGYLLELCILNIE